MLIEYLQWDSDFFGIKIGRVCKQNIHGNHIAIKDQFDSEGYNLVYIFSDQIICQHDLTLLQNVELADIIVHMSKEMKNETKEEIQKHLINNLSEYDIHDTYAIAEQISEVSRFSKETLIGKEKAKGLYRKWIDNSLNKTFADGLLVARNMKRIVGIHSIKTSFSEGIGACSLIGVSASFKGNGTGADLWKQAFKYWSSFPEIKKVIVPFSLNNKSSFNFHLKIGFNKVEKTEYIYHLKR